ncbi:DUF262 domain-containing protein [Campylobacter ureolyticus]|uniref:DUF262 domain-containing protein n=1 Tax=Campylobacter ureolyticus TaxID=827 RepID=A0A9Q4KQC3_9BACT|nr:DUF262 domain-containing protein [Campylobacter ureolyticus]MCZ6103534.1 DUF262 domain-containing protein [Campylobacter ureolyticus]MCZ6134040.1 DUF262 domain-containing protein [Campylobacter ureolyticus]MCZ6161781.1 DUF262 domain-containing protein [Campylobacter ureolyticus]MCZ6170630.1 DUF262 domain-containing protein [Campylobacter ureolyticus]MDU4981667.1 DUF262 domain-containing protein [Campylobacter ureolyticus]
MSELEKLDVGVASIGEIFNLLDGDENTKFSPQKPNFENLRIPNYQRPYRWTTKNVNELIDDILEAMNNKKSEYLIGNIILHKNKDGDKEYFDIVDGQQRLTTLALIFYLQGKDEVNLLANEVDINSITALEKNFNIIKKCKKIDDKFINFLKEKVIITYTITNDLDQAFILFSSQNTRGKPLDDKDLLKGHHIRFINRKTTQQECAKEFEKTLREKRNNSDVFSIVLTLLSIIKSGSKSELQGVDLLSPNIYENFKSEFLSDDIIFNNYHNNFIATSSVQGGEAFFKYLKKYTELYNGLTQDEIFTCYENLWGGNLYLARTYQAIILFYRDKFNDDSYDIEKALQILLLNFRLEKDSVRKESVASDFEKWFKEIEFASNKEVFKNKLKEYIRNNILFKNGFSADGQRKKFEEKTYFINEIKKEFTNEK